MNLSHRGPIDILITTLNGHFDSLEANMCTNLRHAVLVSSHFRIYQLISAISKKHALFQLTVRILANSQRSIKLNQKSSHRIRICASLVRLSNGVNLGCQNDSEMAFSRSYWCNGLLKQLLRPPKQNNVSNDST